MNKKYDVAIVLPHFEAGGAQKVARLLLEALTKSEKKCALIVIFNKQQDKYLTPDHVGRYDIFSVNSNQKSKLKTFITRNTHHTFIDVVNFPRRVLNAVRIILKLRKTLIEVNARSVVSFLTMTNLATIAASAFKDWRLVISERNDISKQIDIFPLPLLRRVVYKRADVVTANTYHSVKCMTPYVSAKKLRYVPNPINPLSDVTLPKKRKGFLFIGRLVPQKSVHTLIEAFGAIETVLQDWILDIVGDGPEMVNLKKMVQEKHLGNKVIFHGHQSDVTPYYKKNAIFVLPSLYEGMPNVLLEAMSFSMPMIVSDACPGAVELTENGQCGFVFPTSEHVSLSKTMLELATDQKKITAMGLNSSNKVKEFHTSNVLDIWQTIIFNQSS